ncbi:MAG TPA: flagellar biosynthetic protein FliQ [Stellaceae bacterium]|nr:flagellar biosynthetic protein FliQ [Stellaceae bacterium]
MNAGEIAAAVRDMLTTTLLLMSPFLLAATVISLLVGMIQAGTRINDLTLSFVPRFVATLLVAYFAAAWAVAHLIFYIERSAAAAGMLGR